MSKTKPAGLTANTVVGGYTIVRQLSIGGFGIVYLAKSKNDSLVAIKEYLPSSLVKRESGSLIPIVAPDKLTLYTLGLKSFFEEGRALAQIAHPAVVGVQNFFRENETVYMVMNYLHGATLQDFVTTARSLNRDKILRESTIRSLFDEILNGLRIVHQSRMIHLDIKPANILIKNSNHPVLIDFGAARQVLNKENQLINPMYTPGFAAPEMYTRKGELGPWTDIYAIGSCLFTCMNGYPPNDALARKTNDKLSVILSRLRGVYSDNLIELVQWCLTLDPLARPQSVFELQKELLELDNLRYPVRGLGEKLRQRIGTVFS